MDHGELSRRNFFVGARLDRLAQRRNAAEWIDAHLGHDDTVFVPVCDALHPWLGGDRARPFMPVRHELEAAGAAPDEPIFLGCADGRAYFAIELERETADALPADFDLLGLREIGPLVDWEEGAILSYARAMTFWHARHRHCGRCGAPTRSEAAGHMRVCTESACAEKHFPRTDPAVITLVYRRFGGEDRCLLGRSPAWPAELYSTVAGFVEPGESLEHAVAREVLEETGIRTGRIQYCSSQPWPFPSSLMLGFRAQALSEAIVLEDDELADARWFSRSEIVDGLADGSLALPRRLSIASRLIEDWFDEGSLGALRGYRDE